jgi:hypothetical protein
LAQLSVPQGADTIAVHDGKVYIAAANFNGPVGIRAVDPDGVIRTVAGTGQPLPPGPPTTFGTSALLTPMSPTAIAFDGAGNLYYVDAGNYVGQIRMDGSVHLVAGCGGACTKDIDGFFTCGPACSSTINGQDAKSSAVGNTL